MSPSLPAPSSPLLFVGRQPELDRWRDVLADPRGQAVLVVGPPGMGKTLLLNRMAALARAHPNLRCGCVREEVTPNDSPASPNVATGQSGFCGASLGRNRRKRRLPISQLRRG